MSATETVTVGEALPKLASVEPANGPFSVSVTWAAGARTGRTDIVDLAPMIFTFKVFKPLRDNPELFRSVRVGEWGASLVWPGNDDLDIGAESVEEMAEEVMTNSDFAAFLKRTGFTLDAAAAQLGIARRLVAYYAKDREIPRYIGLACRQLETEAVGRMDAADAADVCLGAAPAGGFHGWVIGGDGFVVGGSLPTGTGLVSCTEVRASRGRVHYSDASSNPRPVKKAGAPVHNAGGIDSYGFDLSMRKPG